MTRKLCVAALAIVAPLSAGCGGHQQSMGPMGPSGLMSGPGASSSLVSVSPAGSATSVATTADVVLRFATGMAPGTEQLVDLHRGDLAGPTVPLSCGWSADRTTLTCTHEPLESHTLYWLHVGGGLMSQLGQPVDFDQHGPAYGGQWVQGGMMTAGIHAGLPWSGMAPGWHGRNGGYGMAFAFTTA